VRTPRSSRLLALFLATALALAACSRSGSGDDGDAGSDAAADDGAPAADAFPVTIEHAFGTTEIAEEPERVVTWGWGGADAAIALGVVPVAIPFEDYGGDEDGVLPWIRQALDAGGDETPEMLPNVDEPPFEAIAAARPDVIIAAYSGITEEEYDLLADIAPTVAYPDEAWSTPWRDLIGIVGTALGRSEQAAGLLDEIDAAVEEQAEAHPELDGKSVALVWDTPEDFYVYKPADSRVEFTLDLGLVSAPSVDELSTDESTFYFTLSLEQLGALESDILVSYADTQEASDAFLASDHARLMPQVREGRVAEVVGTDFIASVSPPTALSLTWGLDEYVDLLSDAAS
jgi:iron-siderophore transport system substrate-binding protein